MADVRTLPVGEASNEILVTLDDLAREGARRMIAAALDAEVDEYVASFIEETDDGGKRLVVRNGRARERGVTVGSGTVRIRAPSVNDKRVDENGERERFGSKILPAYARRSPKVTEVLPVLYLHGLSTGDFEPALLRATEGGAHECRALRSSRGHPSGMERRGSVRGSGDALRALVRQGGLGSADARCRRAIAACRRRGSGRLAGLRMRACRREAHVDSWSDRRASSRRRRSRAWSSRGRRPVRHACNVRFGSPA